MYIDLLATRVRARMSQIYVVVLTDPVLAAYIIELSAYCKTCRMSRLITHASGTRKSSWVD